MKVSFDVFQGQTFFEQAIIIIIIINRPFPILGQMENAGRK
jgi:hypothetical protein